MGKIRRQNPGHSACPGCARTGCWHERRPRKVKKTQMAPVDWAFAADTLQGSPEVGGKCSLATWLVKSCEDDVMREMS